MPILRFPDPETGASPEGIVGIGGDLHHQSLLMAYGQGIFPWPVSVPGEDEPLLAWFCPPERAVLRFEDLHVPRSLAKAQRRAAAGGWRFSVDEAFSRVIRACAKVPRRSDDGSNQGTWITPEMIEAYEAFHRRGHAHSVEAWDEAGALVGGLYGVCVNGVFAGESMFHTADDASKMCVLHLAQRLRAAGSRWIDVQVMTPHFERLGAAEVPRREFLRMLRAEQARKLELF